MSLFEDDFVFYTRYKPQTLDRLCKNYAFSKKEIRMIYQGFKQECPTGIVNEEAFKNIFGKFFPLGDATQYAHFVFKTFKERSKNSGTLNFEQFLGMLSTLSRGSLDEKLQWIFALYDVNGDGFITKQEMEQIVRAIYDMLGSYTQPEVDEKTINDHVNRVFHQIDLNQDGVITFDEIEAWCQNDEMRANNLLCFDTVFPKEI